jgi:ribosome-binding factor A
MASKGRAIRVAQRVKEELAELLLFEVSDPRLSGVYITEVRVDRELAYANIFVSALEGVERQDEILEGLEHAKGFLRYQLAQLIELRAFPQLRFNWDPTPEYSDKIDRLIASLHKGDPKDEVEDE